MVTPKNPQITISSLGKQKKFVSGNKYWLIEWAELSGKRFEAGNSVSWYCPDTDKTYKGVIEWIIIVENGDVQISMNNPDIGRVGLNEIEIT